MKKFFLLSIFFLGLVNLYAQGQQSQRPSGQRMSPEERAKRTTQMMKEALLLTDEQVAPVDSINLLYAKAQRALIERAAGDREKIMEAITALEAQKTEAFQTVLTPEQMEKYKKQMEEMRNRFRNREGNSDGQRSRRQQESQE